MNQLFPVFLKIEHLKILVVGGGYVGHEKGSALLNNCPNSDVTFVAPMFREGVLELKEKHPNVKLIEEAFHERHLEGIDLVIAGTSIKEVNLQVQTASKRKKILVNVADTPDLCDFYLGSIVQKGDLKIGISTNGKSPTFAKRFRELLEETLPDSIQEALENLYKLREKLRGDFEYKVQKLNEITSVLKNDKTE